MLPRELEDWLTEEGDRVVRKRAELGAEALTTSERLLYAVWLFDTETRNGAVSQYFCNRGLVEWSELRRLAGPALSQFGRFSSEVQAAIEGHEDPYSAVLAIGRSLDERYASCAPALVSELRVHCERAFNS